MKIVLVMAAALGLSVSAAAADCAGHAKVTTSVDTETTVASVVKQTPAAARRTVRAGRTGNAGIARRACSTRANRLKANLTRAELLSAA